MPRQLKPQPVGEPVADSILGVSVQIYLNRNTLDFFADFEGHRFEDSEADKVRRQVEDALKAARSLSWIPVIEVQLSSEFAKGDENMIGFDLDRYWLARKGDGRFLKAHWSCDTDARRADRSSSKYVGLKKEDALSFPVRISHNSSSGDEFLLAYSEEVWAGLIKIQTAINEARERLERILSDPEGVKMIGDLTLPRLSAGYGFEPAGGPYAKYLKGEVSTSADLMELEEGETCPDCKRPFKAADVADLEDSWAALTEAEDYCSTCGMIFYAYEASQTPPPDPNKAVELSSWDYRALKLIFEHPGKLTEGDWNGIAHLSDDLKSRGLIVFDAADQPFLTPRGINSLREADPNKDSNPPLELATTEGVGIMLRPQAVPVQIQTPADAPAHRAPSRGLPTCETCHGTGLTEYGPDDKKLDRPIRCYAFDCPVNDRSTKAEE